MKRQAAAGAVAVVLVLALAGPAHAKLLFFATVTGPGLHAPVEIPTDMTGGLWDSGVMQRGKERSLEALGLSRADLGPRYRIVYRLDLDFDGVPGPDDPMIRQDVFPHAQPGPVTFTYGRKVPIEEGALRFPRGWWVATPGFRDYLVWGVLAGPPSALGSPSGGATFGGASSGPPATADEPEVVPGTPAPPWLVAAGLLSLLGILAWAGRPPAGWRLGVAQASSGITAMATSSTTADGSNSPRTSTRVTAG